MRIGRIIADQRLQLFGGFLAVFGAEVKLGQFFAQAGQAGKALQELEVNANGFFRLAEKRQAVGQLFHEQRIGSFQIGSAIEHFQCLRFDVLGIARFARARVSGVELAQINEEPGIGGVAATCFVEDLQSLIELIALQIELGEISVAHQGIGHFANSSAIRFDGEVFFAKDRVNSAELGKEDSRGVFFFSSFEEDFLGFFRLLELKEAL